MCSCVVILMMGRKIASISFNIEYVGYTWFVYVLVMVLLLVVVVLLESA